MLNFEFESRLVLKAWISVVVLCHYTYYIYRWLFKITQTLYIHTYIITIVCIRVEPGLGHPGYPGHWGHVFSRSSLYKIFGSDLDSALDHVHWQGSYLALIKLMNYEWLMVMMEVYLLVFLKIFRRIDCTIEYSNHSVFEYHTVAHLKSIEPEFNRATNHFHIIYVHKIQMLFFSDHSLGQHEKCYTSYPVGAMPSLCIWEYLRIKLTSVSIWSASTHLPFGLTSNLCYNTEPISCPQNAVVRNQGAQRAEAPQ